MKNVYVKSLANGAFALVFVARSAGAQAVPPVTPPAPDIHVIANPTYVSIPVEITVNRPAAEVWAQVGKFCFFGEAIEAPCTIISGKDGELQRPWRLRPMWAPDRKTPRQKGLECYRRLRVGFLPRAVYSRSARLEDLSSGRSARGGPSEGSGLLAWALLRDVD